MSYMQRPRTARRWSGALVLALAGCVDPALAPPRQQPPPTTTPPTPPSRSAPGRLEEVTSAPPPLARNAPISIDRGVLTQPRLGQVFAEAEARAPMAFTGLHPTPGQPID